MAVNPAHAAPMIQSDGGEGFCKARSTGFCEPGAAPKNDWISEETWSALRAHGHLRRIRFRDVRRRALLLRCILVRCSASRGLEVPGGLHAIGYARLMMLCGAVSTYKHLPCVRPARKRQAWSSEIG